MALQIAVREVEPIAKEREVDLSAGHQEGHRSKAHWCADEGIEFGQRRGRRHLFSDSPFRGAKRQRGIQLPSEHESRSKNELRLGPQGEPRASRPEESRAEVERPRAKHRARMNSPVAGAIAKSPRAMSGQKAHEARLNTTPVMETASQVLKATLAANVLRSSALPAAGTPSRTTEPRRRSTYRARLWQAERLLGDR